MHVVVTGAAGRLGLAVCRDLTMRGHHVTGIDRISAPGDPSVQVVDLLDSPRVQSVVAGAEAVVHLGNHTSYLHGPPTVIYGENVAMNWNVARAAIVAGARRFIFASTVQVVSGETELDGAKFPTAPAYVPGDADLPAIPRNPYALSKQAGEDLLRYLTRTHGMATVAIRFPYLRHESSPVGAPFVRPTEFISWLSYADGAALVGAILARDLPGFRIYFPAARAALNGRPVEENLERHFAGIPRHGSGTPVDALVDCSAITRETGWQSTA